MDDPTALKEIVLLVQESAIKLNKELSAAKQPQTDSTKPSSTQQSVSISQGEGTSEHALSALPSRVRFMLESIYDLKNNKQKNLAAAMVHLGHLKKTVRAISKTGMLTLSVSSSLTLPQVHRCCGYHGIPSHLAKRQAGGG